MIYKPHAFHQTMARAAQRAGLWLCALFALSAAFSFSALAQQESSKPTNPLEKIKTVVVIYAENHSFDNLYGLFPGANGIARATPEQYIQLDHDGMPLKKLVAFGKDGKPDPTLMPLPNQPFRIDAPPVNRPPTQMVPSPTHTFYHHQEQINGGKNNMFVAMSSVGAWTMGYYDGSAFALWQWAKEYTLADNFFMGAFGGSFLNHQFLVCACAPVFPNAPQSMRARLDANGKLEKYDDSPSASKGAVRVYSSHGGQVSPDGYAVNTSQPSYQPSGIAPAIGGSPLLADPAGSPSMGLPIPPQISKTIGDTLSEKGIEWVWYAGGYTQAVQDGMQPPNLKRAVIYNAQSESPNFQPHHQPFNYFLRFAPGTKDRELHFKDGTDFIQAIEQGRLPAVSFYKPAGVNTQHPSYTTLMQGDKHIDGILKKLKSSPQWGNMLVIVTYDENGGYWDHVAPPTGTGWGDRWGPGSRIPAILVGPWVKKGFIDPTPYDTTSILKFLTLRFELAPLAGVRANTGDLSNALTLER